MRFGLEEIEGVAGWEECMSAGFRSYDGWYGIFFGS